MENQDNIEVVETTIIEDDKNIKEEEEKSDITGYTKTEADIIKKARNTRGELLDKIIASNPRGKDLESAIILLNDQESSAHKTAATRLKIKEEDTNNKINANMIAMLAQERDRNRQNAIRNGTNNNPDRLVIPKDYEPDVIVDGEMSQIDRNEHLDVNNFMSEGDI